MITVKPWVNSFMFTCHEKRCLMITVVRKWDTTCKTSLDANLFDKRLWFVTHRGHPNHALTNCSATGKVRLKKCHSCSYVWWGPTCDCGRYIMRLLFELVRLIKTIRLDVFSGPYWGNVKPPDWRFRFLCPWVEPRKCRPVKRKHSLLLQRRQAASEPPAARLVGAVSDQCGSSILRQGSRRVMLLGNGALTLPIMQQARKPEQLSGLPSSARERWCLSRSTCATRWLGFDSSAV